MLRTLEAVIDQKGAIRLLEPVRLTERRRALVTILDDLPETNGRSPRPFGLCTGEFVVPDDFDAPLPPEVLVLFEVS
ncbi:MAG: type II toxin-antitoxin system Phd/YefM family antitoxin [Anaerolineae bacterium]|jgi:hypothetical protein